MNFLSPWFLLGALAVAGPIVFHLIRRVVRDKIPFSSLMFLKPTPPRVTQRRKFEHLWLLLLRCLCLLLLAAGFARPFFAKDSTFKSPAGENRQIILLVDTSASMRREGLWNQACAIAERYLEKTSPTDQVAIIAFDRQTKTILNFSEWSSWNNDQRAAMAKQRLAAISPGWMNTQLGLALASAAEQFADDPVTGKPAGRCELVLISDLQEGAKLDGLQGHEWPGNIKVIVERVNAVARANAGLEILGDANTAASNQIVRVRVTNARDSNREKFRLSWTMENKSDATEIYLAPGQTRTFNAPKLPAGMTSGKLQLSGDETDFDNQSYYVAPEAERLKIAWFGVDSANDPGKLRYYFQRVFSNSSRRKIEIAPPTLHSEFSAEAPNQSLLAVIPSPLSAGEVTAVRDWLARGKTALLVLPDTQMTATLVALTDLHELHIVEASGDFALLGQIDFAHPLFAPFADPRFSDFSHIHFWKHRRVEFPASGKIRVLAKFDDGSPALAQIPIGSGNLLVLASGWNPGDSQLAVSSKFPPLMQSLLDWSGAATPACFQFQTGDTISFPGSARVSPANSIAAQLASRTPALSGVQWISPDGKTKTLAANKSFSETDVPGIYLARFAGKERRFAVNLPLDESRTSPMSPDELARLGVPLQTEKEFAAAPVAERMRYLQEAEMENRQKLWRWLIVAALAVTFGEIILAGKIARRAKTSEASS